MSLLFKSFIFLLLLFSTTNAMVIDTSDASNGNCPGETITQIDNLSTSFNESATGSMNVGWDVDRLHFTVGDAGLIKITLSSPDALTIKAGNECNSETYFRSSDSISHSQEFRVSASDVVDISIFDWTTGGGYDYTLGIEFVSDSGGETPPPVPSIYGLETRPTNNGNCIFPTRPGDNSGNIDDLVLSTVTAFPNVSISNPVGLYQAPGNNDRWYAIELSGKVKTFLQSGGGSTALDITDKTIMQNEQGLLGMAFHPNYPTSPYVFLSYTDLDGDTVISRFTVENNGLAFSKSSEKIILQVEQPYSNHNGGNIAFGHDGYLYIGLGDGGSGNDPHDNAQNLSKLLGSMLRIDVDNGDPYAIPVDNPFATNSKAVDGTCSGECPEIFAWGIRNPWRWSFDKATGLLWAGDVGQKAWEEINIIEKGKNYGWRCKEGSHFTANGCTTSGFTDPIIEYPNTGYNAVTGGYVYRGNTIPALKGVYLYSDYVTGSIKGYLPNNTSKTLINNGPYIASFAEGNNGDLYILDVWAGTIKKIIATAGANSGVSFPEKLSQTGCYQNLEPSNALIPFDVNTLLWTDNLDKQRWLALQDGTTITVDNETGQWIFPIGTVIMKDFSKDGKMIETRFLARHNDGNWGAFTYKWNDANTDADLVDVASSINEDIGGQIWTYPSEAQCFACHTVSANIVLGPETAQMNLSRTYESTGIFANQIDTFNHIGIFSPTLETEAKDLDTLPSKDDTNASLQSRARAYLHSNCSYCHMPNGGTPSSMDFRYFKPLSQTMTCNQEPLSGNFGIEGANLITPGDAENSILPYRMNTLGEGRMPPLGTHVVDETGVQLLSDWINSLSDCND